MQSYFDITDEEIPIFQAEADEQLQILDEGLVILERSHDDQDLLQSLFRAAHTLKGSSGMIGHKRMVELTHAMESALDGLRKGQLSVSAELIDTCLESVDILRLLCAEVHTGKPGDLDITPLASKLRRLSDAGAGSPKSNVPRQETASDNAPQTPIDGDSVVIQAYISPESIASAARAFQVVMELQANGAILDMDPTMEHIEQASPVDILSVHYSPQKPLNEIVKSLRLISEVDEIRVNGQKFEELAAQPLPAPEPEAPVKSGNRDVPLGKLLVDNGLISKEQLEQALKNQQQEEGPNKVLGETLIEMGLVTQELLDEVVAVQSQEKERQQVIEVSKEQSRVRAVEKTVRTSVERLDNLMNLVGELITDRNRMNLIRNALEVQFRGQEQVEALSETIAHIGRITDQLQTEVMGIRMLPISNVFNKFPRMVRDLSRKASKQIDLVMRGEDTELDRSVIEEISDPLIHLLRNAIDHGIETSQERLAAGKTERGIIQLTARHEQGRIIITVEDNGSGIDLERVKTKAVDKGIIGATEAAGLSDEEAIELIFTAGLSTARVVSDISGRGVGMDIVRNNIERLNGSIQVETWLGKGTQFQIVLPLTLAIVPTLLVGVYKSTYAIPLVTVIETLRVAPTEIKSVDGFPVISLRDRTLPIVRLANVFALGSSKIEASNGAHEYVVVVRAGKLTLGLIVDRLVGEEEVVVKSLTSLVGEISGISSAAILGDGQVALIVDVTAISKMIYQQRSTHRQGGAFKSAPQYAQAAL